jgi:hypothetical protein
MDSINVDQVDLGDNEFIRLGNSQDLTMVHTSTQSIINQAGIGDLLLQKAGATKLTINASGIDVTGTVTADGLTVGDTSASQSLIQMLANPTNGANTIHFGDGTSADAYVGYINYAHDSNSMQFSAGGSTRATIDGVTGSVGIGAAPSAWASAYKVLQLGSASSMFNTGSSTLFATNAYIDSGFAWRYQNSSYSSRYTMESGGHAWYNAPSGTAGDAVGFTQVMTLDASGNLLVGGTTYEGSATSNASSAYIGSTGFISANVTNDFGMQVNRTGTDGVLANFRKDGVDVGSIGTGSGLLTIGTGTGNLLFENALVAPCSNSSLGASDGVVDLGASARRFKDLYLSGTAKLNFINHSETIYPTTDATVDIGASSERYRNLYLSGGVLAGNPLLIGISSAAGVGGSPSDTNSAEVGSGYINLNRDDTSSANQIQFGKNGSVAGRITTTTTTSYVETSDRRVKDNIADADDCGAEIDLMQVRKFDWRDGGVHHPYGMIAQELQQVAPIAVDAPENPEEMMGIDYSKLVPMLVKEIQSLRARIAALES